MKKYIPSILLVVLYVCGEAHNIYKRFSSYNLRQNWIIAAHEPMSFAWNVKFCASQLQWMLVAIMVITYGKYPNKFNKTSMYVFLTWTIFDTISYFYNYKRDGYYWIYLCLPILWIIIFKSKSSKKHWNK